jgi:hypothetical protein
VPQNTISRFANHFFTTFLVHNDFAGASLDFDTITCQFQSTPSLHHVAIAVGAINLAPSSVIQKSTIRLEALNSYRASISEFQKEIQSTESKGSDECLWTTFFLGLFEVRTSFLLGKRLANSWSVNVRRYRRWLGETYLLWDFQDPADARPQCTLDRPWTFLLPNRSAI